MQLLLKRSPKASCLAHSWPACLPAGHQEGRCSAARTSLRFALLPFPSLHNCRSATTCPRGRTSTSAESRRWWAAAAARVRAQRRAPVPGAPPQQLQGARALRPLPWGVLAALAGYQQPISGGGLRGHVPPPPKTHTLLPPPRLPACRRRPAPGHPLCGGGPGAGFQGAGGLGRGAAGGGDARQRQRGAGAAGQPCGLGARGRGGRGTGADRTGACRRLRPPRACGTQAAATVLGRCWHCITQHGLFIARQRGVYLELLRRRGAQEGVPWARSAKGRLKGGSGRAARAAGAA